MTNNKKHTPAPWKDIKASVSDNDYGFPRLEIEFEDRCPKEMSIEDGEFLLEAVNQHEALTALVKELVGQLEVFKEHVEHEICLTRVKCGMKHDDETIKDARLDELSNTLQKSNKLLAEQKETEND